MKRRDFSKGLLAAGLAAPPVLGPTSSVANVIQQDDEARFQQFVRMQLILPGQVIQITWLLLLFSTVLGLNFQRTIPRYLLQRAALGALSLGLQRAPFPSRFQGALLLGQVILWSNMLMILPLLRNPPTPKKVIVANDEYEYVHPGTLDAVQIRGLPSVNELRRQPVIGSAGINSDGEVGVIIPRVSMKFRF